MNTTIDIATIPTSRRSPDWEVPQTFISKNESCGQLTGLIRTGTKTEIGATIRQAAIDFTETLRQSPSLEYVHSVLQSWKDPSTGKIQRMVFRWLWHYNPVYIAATIDRMDIVQVLLDYKFKLPKGGVRVLADRANEKGDISILEFMVRRGWLINESVDKLGPILSFVTEDQSLVKWCLANGADPNVASEEGYTALHGAASNASISTLQLLLDAGGDISPSSTSRGVVAHATLAHSKKLDRFPMIRFLLEKGADINAIYQPNKEHKIWTVGSMNALHFAVRDGHRDLVKYLIETGADTKMKALGAATAFRWMSVGDMAEWNEHGELRKLLESGGEEEVQV